MAANMKAVKLRIKSVQSTMPVSYTHLDVYKRQFLYHTHDQIMSELKKIILNFFSSNGMTGILHKSLIFVNSLKNLYKSFLPGIISFFTLKSFSGFLQTGPLCQIINISEMVIKSHAADPAVRGKIIDGDPVQGFFQHKPFQGLFQGIFCHILQKIISISGL